MQGNKVYMLTKKSGNLNIVGYSDIVLARCVDIKVSTLSYIHTLAYEAISWKKLHNDFNGISNDAIYHVACKEAKEQVVCQEVLIPKLRW